MFFIVSTRNKHFHVIVGNKRVIFFSKKVLFVLMLLLLSGGVEMNTGLATKGLKGSSRIHVNPTAEWTEKVLAKSNVIENKQTEFHKKIGFIAESYLLEKRISNTEVNGIKREVRLDNHEIRKRRMNFVLSGIPDNAVRDSWEESETIVKRICRDSLGIDATSIQRAHRLGTIKDRGCRPYITSFRNWKERDGIMRNAFQIQKLYIQCFRRF